jgi:hypothetical protein
MVAEAPAHIRAQEGRGAFAAEIERRKEVAELVLLDQANRTVEELATEWWRRHVVPNLAE